MADFAANILGQAITQLGKNLAAAIKRQFSYFCCLNSNIQSLKVEGKILVAKKDTLQRQVAADRDKGRVIRRDVETWLKEVEEIQDVERTIVSNNANVQNECLKFISQFPRSKEAKKTAEAMKKLYDGCEFDPISLSPPSASTRVPILSERTYGIKSREEFEEKVMKALRDENINTLGICGMGGLGKTTMAENIRHRGKVENLFDETVMVVVSQPPVDKSKIQLEIAQQLGCQEEVKNKDSTEVKKHTLFSRLSGRKILIVLDDIWEHLKLEDLGIPCGKDSKGCTVLLTSRAEDVLKKMNAKVLRMEILTESEAWSLFKYKAGNCADDPSLTAIAKEVAHKCNGLPVAIVTVASALKDEERPIWQDALDRLTGSSSMLRYIEKEEHIPLRLSYDYLKDPEAELVFLLCCLYPEDYCIRLESLVFNIMGLKSNKEGLIGASGAITVFEDIHNMEQAKNRVFTVVKKLKSRCLLLDSYDESVVKMHDVIREVATSIATERKLIDTQSGSKAHRDRCCEWISVFTESAKESLDQSMACNFPSLRLLIIFPHSPETLEISDISFLKRMPGLQVMSLMSISLKSQQPQSIELLNNLRSLQLFYCKFHSLCDVGALLNLEILRIQGCEIIISHENYEDGMSSTITFPKLKYLKWVAPPCLTTICKGSESIEFASLEELEVKGCHRDWQRRQMCADERSDDQEDDEKAPHLFCGQRAKLCGLKFLSLKQYNMRNVWCHQVPLCFFQTLERLTLYDCPKIISLFSSTMSENIVNLNYLSVNRCDGMKEVFIRTGENEEGKTSVVTFPKLKVLWLCDLPCLTSLGKGIRSIELPMLEELKINRCPKLTSIASLMEEEENRCYRDCGLFCGKKVKFSRLKHLELELWGYVRWCIWCHKIPLCSFRTLERLEISHCNNIESVFSYSMVENLVQLNELSIKWCESVKAVFAMQENEDRRRKSHVIAFPNLKRLELKGLKSLCYIVTLGEGTECIELPMLYDLKIKACPKLRSLVALPSMKEIDYEACPLFDQKIMLSGLGSIEIYCCDNIKSVFSSPVVNSFTSLKHLAIADCNKMEKVIIGDKGMHENSVLLPRLEKLVLRHLEYLEMFCEWRCALEFPLLEDISVIYCRNLKVLTPGSMQTPKLNKMKVDDRSIKKERLKETKDPNSLLRQYDRLERQITGYPPRDTEFSKYDSDPESFDGYSLRRDISN